MKIFLKAFAVVVTFASISYCSGGKVNTFSLPNGLKVIHKQVSRLPLVTFQVFMDCGKLNECDCKAGLSLLTQNLMFKGTTSRSAEQLAKDLEDIGANTASDMQNDYCYTGISVMKQHSDRALELWSDILFNPAFKEEEFQKERVNALAAIQSRQDHIFHVAFDYFNEKFYGLTHPYSWPEQGREDTVKKLELADIVNWHKEYYAPNNMLLVIVGDIKLKRAEKLVNKYFLKYEPAVLKKTSPEAKPPEKAELQKNTEKFQQAYYVIGFPAPKIDDPDYPKLKVINSILGSRMSGRLFTELREKLSLAYEVNSFYPSRKQLSQFVIYIGLKKENLDLAGRRINEILGEISRTPVSQKELDETRNYIKGIYMLDHQTIEKQAWYYGWWERAGKGYEYDDKYMETLDNVTIGDIRDTAARIFSRPCVSLRVVPNK